MPEPEGGRRELVVNPRVEAVVIVGGVPGGQWIEPECSHHGVA